MRKVFLSLFAVSWLLCACDGSAFVQGQPPPGQPPPGQPPPPPPPPPPEKAAELPKGADTKRGDGPSVFVAYTLAAIGTIVVMVLVCFPARRE